MKINSIYSQHLSNALHLQFASETKDIIEKFDPSELKIVPQYEILRASIEKEDLCYKIIHKSNLSEAKEDADQVRDAVIIGINDAVRTALRHFTPTVRDDTSGDGTTGGGTSEYTGADKLLNCRWRITYFRFDSNSKKIEAGFEVKTCKDCALTCNFNKDGNCKTSKLCPIDYEKEK
jgi:hypothetical protein